jgi:arsenite/tail-anchored protein-transporting ATPase
MPSGLLDHLGRRTTFVVGKGGVGKTTTAGGIALALADRRHPTHLLSTDPAHSLADLFLQPLLAGPTPSACTDRLVLEELDAQAEARRCLAALEPALLEIIDRGTYLDPDDAEALLEAAVPALDEIGAALRIGTLARSGERLVVDTAPTGHTLRLLDAEAMVASWLQVFEAMAAKAQTVASALVGQTVRLLGEEALAGLAEDMARFTAVLRDSDFLVVTGAGDVEKAETVRLVTALRERGLRVAATVAMARPGATADFLLPVHPALHGCEALRLWAREDAPLAIESIREPRPGPALSPPPVARPVRGTGGLPVPLDRELLVFAGKGGVGKTTCAAAVAVRLAGTGRVVALGTDPAGSLHDVIGGEVAGLRVRESAAEVEFERMKERYRRELNDLLSAAGLDAAARMDRNVIESLWSVAPPGIDELVAIARLAGDMSEEQRLVLDTAPTGHFLRLIATPDLALDWTHRLMRILIKYRAVGALDAPGGPLLRLARRLRTVGERLADPARTSIVVVTVDEPMIRAETGRLMERLVGLGLPLAAVVVNRAVGNGVRPLDEALTAGLPVFVAPTVAEPVGAPALLAFFESWSRAA